MSKAYKIQKFFRGGSSIYYASMPQRNQMKRGCWKYQLEEWGEGTNGGFNYGYQVKVNQVKSIPRKINKFRKLSFNPYYLVKAAKKKVIA